MDHQPESYTMDLASVSLPRAINILILPACLIIGLGLAAFLKQREPNRYDALVTLEMLGDPTPQPPDLSVWENLSDATWLERHLPEDGIHPSWGNDVNTKCRRLAESLVILPVDASSQVRVGYRGQDPVATAALTNALIERWLTDGAERETQFRGQVTLQINREMQDEKIFRGEMPLERSFVPPTFIETEAKVITAKETLYQVVDALKLDETWDVTRKEAFTRLRNNTDTREVQGTDLIVIEYRDTDVELAVTVANEIASAYIERRKSLEENRINNALDKLQQQLRAQSERVEEARLLAAAMLGYRFIDRSTNEAEAAVSQIEFRLEALEGLKGERLLQTAALLDIDDPTLQGLWPMYHQFEMELRGLLNSGLGGKHPQVLEVQRQLDKTKEMLHEAVTSVKKVLPTKLQMAQRAVERAKDERRKAAAEASKDYELEKTMLANMQARFDIEQVDLTMPKVPITVHEHAKPVPAPIAGEAKAKVVTWASPDTNSVRKTWTPSLLWGAGIGLLTGLLLLIALGRRTGEG